MKEIEFDRKLIENIIEDILKKVKDESEFYKSGKTYSTPNLELASEIEKNIKSESEAIEGYYKLLENLKDKEDIKKIQEIIADELNHRNELMEINKKYSKIPPMED